MYLLRLVIFSSFFVNLTLFSQQKQVCITVDDLPVVNYGAADTSLENTIMDKLISSFSSGSVPAIGFVNEKKLFNKDSLINIEADLLKKWYHSGLELGNHTFSHIDYHKATFNEYTNDILKGEIITNEILSGKNTRCKYFRHPFLHFGNSKGKADSLTEFLGSHGYTVAPVTIDNEDYLFAKAYQRAKMKDDTMLMKQIGSDYVIYMEMKLKYFEIEATELFSRDISQILLIHASLLNADYADSLINMFSRNNYRFISLDEALKDEAYKSEITVFGDWGISWIDRWALTRGKRGNFFKDEPVTPDYITEMAK